MSAAIRPVLVSKFMPPPYAGVEAHVVTGRFEPVDLFDRNEPHASFGLHGHMLHERDRLLNALEKR